MKFTPFLLVAGCLLFICSCKSKEVAVQVATPAPVEDVVVIAPPPPPPQIEETPIVEVVSTTDVTVRTESVTPVDRSASQTLFGFYVIIGSFRQIANARQYTNELTAKGFSPEILASENGLFRISVGGYNVENAARAQIAEIRARHAEHRDVWLLVRR